MIENLNKENPDFEHEKPVLARNFSIAYFIEND
jgi:hypothetical protein